MKLIVLENISDVDITDYPIAEPELVNGEVKFDDNGSIKSTGQTLLWSIKVGEKKAFPKYVADILLNRYGVEDQTAGRSILKVVEEKVEENPEITAEVGGKLICKHCGQGFKEVKGLALHIAAKHPDKL